MRLSWNEQSLVVDEADAAEVLERVERRVEIREEIVVLTSSQAQVGHQEVGREAEALLHVGRDDTGDVVSLLVDLLEGHLDAAAVAGDDTLQPARQRNWLPCAETERKKFIQNDRALHSSA